MLTSARSFLHEARCRNPLLFWSAIANLGAFLIMLLISLFDYRAVGGVNTWLKPMKFTASFVIFLLTFAWLLDFIPSKSTRRILSWGFFICMLMEVITIGSQGARAVPSHFNVSTAYDALVFLVMGIFIFINTALTLVTIVLFFRKTKLADPPYILAWRAGLVMFFLGAISGGMMVAHHGHAFGVIDREQGIWFLNWSTSGGDLRVAHFFTLHALQVFPLFVYFVRKRTIRVKSITLLFVIVYSVICLILHLMALSGTPLIQM